MGLVWDTARQHFAIYRQPHGFYVAMPKGWGDDHVKGPMDFALATNETLKVNEVRRYGGVECNDKSFDELLSVYPALVDRGDIRPVTLQLNRRTPMNDPDRAIYDTGWNPPETAPLDGHAFEITTAGPNQDIAWWDGEAFRDYYHKQKLSMKWPYVVGWRPMRPPAVVGETEQDSRLLNGFPAIPST